MSTINFYLEKPDSKGLSLIMVVILFSFLLTGCKDYSNQDVYNVEVGDFFEIYYTTNSCCYYKLDNASSLNSVRFLDEISITEEPRDCAGCSSTNAYLFQAVSVGSDTIAVTNGTNGPNDMSSTDKFVVNVSK